VLGANLGANFLRRPEVHAGRYDQDKKDEDRETELEAAIEKIRQETWKTGRPCLSSAMLSPHPAGAEALIAVFKDVIETRSRTRPLQAGSRLA
jgi:hypothetical protein